MSLTEEEAKVQTLSPSSRERFEIIEAKRAHVALQLRKAWRDYKIAKLQQRKLRMIEYAKEIRRLQGELKVPQSPFPEIEEADLKA